MAAATTLQTKGDRLRRDQARELRQAILAFPDLPSRAVGQILATVDRATIGNTERDFIQLNPTQNKLVVGWIEEHSRRKGVAHKVWAELHTCMRSDTQQVMLSRDDLAERASAHPSHISNVLGELEGIGAISRRRERTPGIKGPGPVAIYVNSWISTRLAGVARDEALAQDQPLDPTG